MNVKTGGATMNKWKEFAGILSLELEQEFVLTDVDGNRKDQFTYKITENGFLSKPPESIDWSVMPICTFTIVNLLSGNIKAVSKPWKPKKGDKYFYYAKAFRQTVYKIWIDENYDLLLWKVGNCFKTEEEAATKGKEIMDQIQKEYEEA